MNEYTNEPVTVRFFKALDYLKEQKIIHGVQNVMDRYNIDRRNLAKLRRDPKRNMLKTFWLTGLVTDYNVSAQWLLTGQGNILNEI